MRVSFKTAGCVSLVVAGLVIAGRVTRQPRVKDDAVELTALAPAKEEAPEVVASPAPEDEDAWFSSEVRQEYLFSDPSPVPNGGLVIEERSLWWGEFWETDQKIERTLLLKNPTDRDLRISCIGFSCGFSIERAPVTVPAGGEVSLPVNVLASTRSSDSDEPFVVMKKRFAPVIKEYPGRHPGWIVHCHVTRAMKVEEQTRDEQFVVTALRPLEAVTAAVDGRAVGVSVDGPDESNRYLVSVDGDALRLTGGEDAYARLQIRGHLPFGAITDRDFGIERRR